MPDMLRRAASLIRDTDVRQASANPSTASSKKTSSGSSTWRLSFAGKGMLLLGVLVPLFLL